jgi:hypothetical protein
MELAGLSVAEATFKSFPLIKKVLVIVGPGNNGMSMIIRQVLRSFILTIVSPQEAMV